MDMEEYNVACQQQVTVKDVDVATAEKNRVDPHASGIEEASESLYLEVDPHARMFEDDNERIAEKQSLEETLSSTILKLAAKENQVNEMHNEVESLRMSESQCQTDLLETKDLLSSKENDLELKVLEFEEMKEKLAVKESIEALVRSSLQQEMDKSHLLEAVVAELTEKLEQMKDKCNDAESELEHKILERNVDVLELSTKLQALMTEKEQMSFEAQDLKCQISELELALNQSSREKSQLEAELENFNKRCAEHESRAIATLERNLELEDSVRQLESLLETEKNRISDLEQEKETRSKEYSDMVFTLSTQLENAVQAGAEKEKGLEMDKEQLNFRVQEFVVKMSELESTLSQTLALKCELESQVKELDDRCVVNESRADVINERNLELEKLVHELEFQLDMEKEQMNCRVQELTDKLSELESTLSQTLALKCELESQVKELNDRCIVDQSRANATLEHNLELEYSVRQLESLLETEKNRISDLEQEKETISKEYSDMVFALSTQLENAVQAGAEREKGLEMDKEQLNFRVQEFVVKMSELESTLSQTLALKCELESQVKELNDRCVVDESRANVINERNLELEELVRKLEFQLDTEKEQMNCRVQELTDKISELESTLSQTLALKCELESQVKELNDRCIVDQSRANATLEHNLELEYSVRQLESLLETKRNRISDLEQEKEIRSKEYSDMVFALSTQLENAVQAGAEREKGLEIDKEQMSYQVQELIVKISELESTLNQTLALKGELESQVKDLNDRCIADESRANATFERNLELEDSVHELESLLETEKNRINALEQEKETRSKEYSDMVFSFSTQLENAVHAGAEKEKSLEMDKEQLNFRVQEFVIKMSELESTLSQTLALKRELESQVKELNDRCAVDESRANVINERNLELEELVRELEFQLESRRSRINYLEQELDNLEQKSAKYYDMVSTLTTQLQSANTATNDIREKLQESERKLEEAELKNLELKDQLTFLKSNYEDADRKLREQMHFQVEELRAKITQVEEINVEHERRANLAQEHILELEDLASDLELLLENRKNIIKNLEQEVEILEKKCEHAEAKSKEHAEMVSALTAEVENEKQLVESLNRIIKEEKRNSEESVHDSKAKLQEAENLLQALHNELLAAQGKLEMAGIKEIEITKKLESAQVQLQEQGRSLEEATMKITELESLNVSLLNDTELKLQELAENLKNKEIEVDSLNEKLDILEHQIQCYVKEAAVMAGALTEELNRTSSLVETNISLTNKVGELQQLLDLANADKEVIASTITEQHETEARFLQETITHKESEVKELSYKCSNLEEKLKIHESTKFELDSCLVKLQDQAEVIQGLEAKLTQLEMQTGALIEENMNLNGKFAESQSKLNELQEKLSSTLVEKESTVQNFETSMKVVEDLKQELSFERQSLQSRIDSIIEEKQLLCEASRIALSEVQTINNELETQLKEYKESNGDLKEELENLKLQATQNSALQNRVKQLDDQLELNESHFKKEIATIMEEKQLLREASTKAQNEVLKLMSELEDQLSKCKESNEALKAELETVMMSNGNGGSSMQTEVKEVEQVVLEGENVSESASRLDEDGPNETNAYTELEMKINDGDGKKRKAGKSPVNNIKIALGVALVSVVTAILAGKQH